MTALVYTWSQKGRRDGWWGEGGREGGGTRERRIRKEREGEGIRERRGG